MAKLPSGLVVLGFGGHARSVADVACALGIRNFIFVDAAALEQEELWGYPALKAFNDPVPVDWQVFPASGDNIVRQQQITMIGERSWPLATLIAPTATIGTQTNISSGCFVGHQAHIGPMSQIGTACIINSGAIVDHECIVGDYSHISINSTVAGRCRLGSFVFFGAGAAIVDKKCIGDSITVGAGGVVIDSLSEPGTYVGNPARRIGASHT